MYWYTDDHDDDSHDDHTDLGDVVGPAVRGAVPGLGEQRVQGLRGDAWHPGVVHAPQTRAPDMTLRGQYTFQKEAGPG